MQQKRDLQVGTENNFWAVGSYSSDEVCLQYISNDAEARATYHASSASKVLFDPAGVPVACCTIPADAKGIGVASILQVRCGLSFDTTIENAIMQGLAPFVPPDRHPLVQRALMSVVEHIFYRPAVKYFASSPHKESLCHYDVESFPGVKGYVGLTIDDAPCMLGRENSMVLEVVSLLRDRDAAATFMLMGQSAGGHEDDLVSLLREGHELGNHGMVDRPYHEDSRESFRSAVDACSEKIMELQRRAGLAAKVHWFRAPHGKYTVAMEQVLHERGLTNVMCDTYACCPVIQDGAFIGDLLARRAQHGSVILIHMPSKGVREWCFEGLATLLDGLRDRGLKPVTLTDLARRAAYPRAAEAMRWQWTWADVRTSWSNIRVAGVLAADLREAEGCRAVRLRVLGEEDSNVFRDAQAAAAFLCDVPDDVQTHAAAAEREVPTDRQASASSCVGADSSTGVVPTPTCLDVVEHFLADEFRLHGLYSEIERQLKAAKSQFEHTVGVVASILGSRQKLGKDWKDIVQATTDAAVAEAFHYNIASAAVASNPVFTSRVKAQAFLNAVHEWFAREARSVCGDGLAEEVVLAWLLRHGLEFLSEELRMKGGQQGSTPLPLPLLPEGKRHDTARQVIGALGTLISLGGWGGACDWAAGDEEVWLGRELDAAFFRKIGQGVVEASPSHAVTARKAVDLLRDALSQVLQRKSETEIVS